jgi:hypothetical protein
LYCICTVLYCGPYHLVVSLTRNIRLWPRWLVKSVQVDGWRILVDRERRLSTQRIHMTFLFSIYPPIHYSTTVRIASLAGAGIDLCCVGVWHFSVGQSARNRAELGSFCGTCNYCRARGPGHKGVLLTLPQCTTCPGVKKGATRRFL